ncbi:amidohydrolase family protein, partial [candidate division KSB1 bacterium]|nr:amidohydrolase family protein [candidate division KSB1 bacterium]
MNTVLINCRLADQESPHQVYIGNGIIEKVTGEPHRKGDYTVIDVGGRLLAPGFIDVHIQGAGGADVLDGTSEALPTISHILARLGTTGFLATSLVHRDGMNQHLRLTAEAAGADVGGAKILGIHLEGPFINKRRRGGIAETCIYKSSPQALQQVLDLTGNALKMMTIAPELEGNLEIIHSLWEKNKVVSFGHSDSSYEETLEGFAAGISHVTHLFNAMPPLNHRQPGPLLAIFENQTVTAQIISDGVHVHPRMVRLTYQLLG